MADELLLVLNLSKSINLRTNNWSTTCPLLNLQDHDPVPAPAGLLDEIRRRGLQPRWARLDRLPHHVERGLAQVFATDRRIWRRPVIDRGRPLLVGNPDPAGGAAIATTSLA